MQVTPPVIVVPGITATYLRDEYSLPPDTVWAVMKKEYERVALHPDNVRYEAREPARIAPDLIFEVAYREMVEELRHNLSDTADAPVPVYPFAYDWRQPLDVIEKQLADFVNEVIERTTLLKHYYAAGYNKDHPENLKVNLVGHSMGGLIITGYLQRQKKDARVSKVATLATPFRGSFEAVIKITTGTSNLGTDAPSSREREASRVTPALYHLLPTCDGISVDPGLPKSIFDAGIWQKSIRDTLKQYVSLHSVNITDLEKQTANLFQSLLGTAQAHRERVNNFSLEQAGLGTDDWLCVAGANSTTRVSLKVSSTPDGPMFEFHSSDRSDLWKNGHTDAERRMTGDGTVPFEAALPTFVPMDKVVCVTPDDYGYWEVQDRIFSAMAGFHGILPNMDMLHRLIVRHFTGRPDPHQNTWGRRAPGVKTWNPPLMLKEK